MAGKPHDNFPRRYIFHGNAVAAGVFLTRIGNIERRIEHPVNGQSSLPVIGGFSEPPVIEPVFAGELGEVFFYAAPQTKAQGIFDGEVAVTTVEASVQKVRVTNWPAPEESVDRAPIEFRAEALRLSMISRHPPEGQPSIHFAEPPLFDGLSLGGQPITLELHDELMRLARWQDLEERFRTDLEFFKKCVFGLIHPGRPLTFGEEIPRAAGGSYALFSFVRSITWGNRTIPGHVLVQPGFGAIYFGEILLNDRERRVTMVRMQLGSQNGGQAVFAENAPDGTWWPPR